jgi:hypothetical protein
MHELTPNECVLGCLERFEPQHEPCHPFYCSVILLHERICHTLLRLLKLGDKLSMLLRLLLPC